MTVPGSPAETALIGRYAESGELFLRGDRSSLAALAIALRTAPAKVVLSVPTARDPGPYDGFLVEIAVARVRGKVRIERRGEAMVISGEDSSREILAKNLEALGAGGLGDHVHIEYHPEHHYLESRSAPLVVERL